jgi:outer membrane biosynthesis protein TonB
MSSPASMTSIPGTLHQNLRNPTWISTIASIGLHGILGIVLPLLPHTPSGLTEPGIPHPVSLVELTPEQQNRLPDFSTPQILFPSIPPSNPEIYSLRPLPNPFTTIPTPLPLPSFSIPPLFIPPPPLAARRPPQPLPSRSSIPTPTPTPANPPAQTESSPPPTQFGRGPGPSELGRLTLPRNQRGPNLEGKKPNATAGSPSPNSSAEPQPSSPTTPTEQRDNSVAYNPEGTDPQSGINAFSQWFTLVSEALGPEWQELSVTAPYPKEVCEISPKREGTAWIGVVVNAEGQVVDDPAEPQLLLSSGYLLFNQQAMEFVKNYEFEKTENPQTYVVSVEFKHNADDCAPSETPEASPSGTPSPET